MLDEVDKGAIQGLSAKLYHYQQQSIVIPPHLTPA